LRLYFHEVRAEQLLFWRNRESAVFTFFLPIVLFVVFCSVYGNDLIKKEHVRGADFLQAGMIGYGVAATCFAGLGITLVIRRESGVLKRLRATPLPAFDYVVAVLTSVFVVVLIEAIVIVAIGRLFYSVPLPHTPFSLLAVLVIGAASFAAMGIGVTGLVKTAEGSSAVINAIFLPMAIISGTFFSPHSGPEVLKVIAAILPLTHFTDLTRNVMLHRQHVWSSPADIAVVLAWGVVGLLGAVRGFRWQPVEA
jgi:ABC-2 type transport system permease protein